MQPRAGGVKNRRRRGSVVLTRCPEEMTLRVSCLCTNGLVNEHWGALLCTKVGSRPLPHQAPNCCPGVNSL